MCILIVEDEYITCKYFSQYIKKNSKYRPRSAHSGKEALILAETVRPRVVFMDIAMETSTSGITACREIKARYPETKVYMVSAYNEDVYQEELADCPYDGFIDKTRFTNVALRYLHPDE